MSPPNVLTSNELAANLVAKMLSGVATFNDTVLKLPIPRRPCTLDDDRIQWAEGALLEEVQEFVDASHKGDVAEAADGLIDLIYFALGRLVEMGVPAKAVFDEVQDANMEKVQGTLAKRPGSKGFDAVKPAGWKAPDHSWLLELDMRFIEDLQQQAMNWQELSPIFQQIHELRIAKGEDYNNVPGGRDAYFPFGHSSYVHMLQTKTLRLQSLVRAMDDGRKPNFEGLVDTARDLVNYGTYYAEALLDGRLSTTSSTAAPLSLAVSSGSDK